MSHIVDSAALGIWCCGDMGRGREWGSIKTEYADPEYREGLWAAPFEWVVEDSQGGGTSGGDSLGVIPAATQQGGDSHQPADGGVQTTGGDWKSAGWVAADEEGGGAGGNGASWKAGGAAGGNTTPTWVSPARVRYPRWNGTKFFSLHLSSKMLHWWRSDDESPPLDKFPGEVGDFP